MIINNSKLAAAIRKAAKVEDPVVLSFCFIVKEDVDRKYFVPLARAGLIVLLSILSW